MKTKSNDSKLILRDFIDKLVQVMTLANSLKVSKKIDNRHGFHYQRIQYKFYRRGVKRSQESVMQWLFNKCASLPD